ncbi:MAG: FkbM family methyltransferase [Bacteroidota bacterium]
MELAPIVLFVYNRPDHTLRTLKALKDNRLSEQSTLYIYADGPKSNDDQVIANVRKVRQTLKSERWCKEVKITERVHNLGLAKNIVLGINEIFKIHTKLIVLEDDIVTSPGFLAFMNTALERYSEEQTVKHVSGYIPPIKTKVEGTFFSKASFCWGWGTWRRAWKEFEINTSSLIKQFKSPDLVKDFNIDDSYDFYVQLIQNFEGKIDTWAVKWYASIFHQDGLCLNPGVSLCRNIGNDLTGINSVRTKAFDWDELAVSVTIMDIRIEESQRVRHAFSRFYRGHFNTSIFNRLKQSISEIFSTEFKSNLKSLFSNELRKKRKEIKKLYSYPRFLVLSTDILGFPITLNDSKSFLFNYKEIFENEVYKFRSKVENPVIIDGGCNIGLSLIYFKKLYPKGKIIGFEADKEIYDIAKNNLKVGGFSEGVAIYNGALWKTEGFVDFSSSGSDSGKIDDKGQSKVIAYRLSKYLKDKVHFLKLDIEGAEYEVLKESETHLKNVEQIFIEYHSFIDKEQKLDEILQILKRNRFRYYLSFPGLSQSNPLIQVNTYMQMDMQVNIYAVQE